MIHNILYTGIIIILVCLFLSHIMSVKIYNKNEYFNNKLSLNNIKTDCDCYDSINNKNKLHTVSSVNLPLDNTIFNVGYNVKDEDKNKMKPRAKYCFPIEKFAYDGVWTAQKQKIRDFSDKQTFNWSLLSKKNIEGYYSTNKFIITPQKQMKHGDIIIQKGNCNEFYPSKYQVNERLQETCNKNNIDSDIIRSPSKFTINGI